NVCVQGSSCTGTNASTPKGGFSTAAVTSAKVACPTGAAGALETATSGVDATQRLGKAWLSCNKNRWLQDRDADAIAFSNDGTWSLFKLGANGALAPLVGLGSRGRWSIYNDRTSLPVA